jgi:formate transporter
MGRTDGHLASLHAADPAALRREVFAALVAKAGLPLWRMTALGLLAGAYIAFGGLFALVALAADGPVLPFGAGRVLAGMVFSLGLILVVVAGAELFTGNTLMIGPLAARSLPPGTMLKALSLVYSANLAGSMVIVLLTVTAAVHDAGSGAMGRAAIEMARTKSALAPGTAFASAILANMLVCLAVWLAIGGRTLIDKVVATVPPIAAFVAIGLEHSVANMFLLPYGAIVAALTGAEPVAPIDVVLNLAVVTAGNIVGGAVLALTYLAAFPPEREEPRSDCG